MNATTIDAIEPKHTNVGDLYSIPMFRGTLKARAGEQRFGRLKLNEETASSLGTDNIGLFVERSPSMERLVEHFHQLDNGSFAIWIVVASSKQVADSLRQMQSREFGFTGSNVVIATPEQLSQLLPNLSNEVAGILIVDYACHIHKSRGFSSGQFYVANDRPQMIVDFRASLRADDWSPPIFLFTNRRAISVNIQPMLSPYCLEAFRFIDGQTMRFGAM